MLPPNSNHGVLVDDTDTCFAGNEEAKSITNGAGFPQAFGPIIFYEIYATAVSVPVK